MKRLLQHYISAYSNLPKLAWLLSLVVLINRSGTIIIFFLSLYLTQERGFDILAAGRIVSIYGLGSLVGSYLGGWLADRWGWHKVQFHSLLWGGLSFIILGYLKNSYAIGGMVFVASLINDAVRPASAMAFAEVTTEENRARGFALMRLAANFGITFGPAVGGLMALRDYKLIFWADGLTCLFAAGIIHFLIKEGKSKKEHKNKTPANDLPPWRDGLFIALMGILFVIAVVLFQIFNTWPLYLKEICGFPENRIGMLMAINALMIVFFEMPLIHALEKKTPLGVIRIGILFLFAGFGLIPIMNSYGYIALTVIVWTIGEMLIFPLVATFITNRASESRIGSYMGLFTLTFSLSLVTGPFIGSWIYHQFGPTLLWMSCGLSGIPVFLGIHAIHRYVQKNRQTGNHQ